MWTHKSLIAGATPPPNHGGFLAVPVTRVDTWSALADDSTGPEVSATGERIWARYRIEGPGGPWWSADFRDSHVLVQPAQDDSFVIPYEDMRYVELPEKKSPAIRDKCGIWYDETFIEGFSGKAYPVRAAAWTDTDGRVVWRNIYCWNKIVAGTYCDRSREGLAADGSLRG
jgi:hypothetical protein